MQPKHKNMLVLSLAAVALIGASVGASALMFNRDDAPAKKVAAKDTRPAQKITWDEPRQQAQPQQQVASNCDDYNIVGTVIGGAAGGLIGNQIGKGSGNTAATIAGAAGGAYAGNQYIPTRNALCAK